MGLAAVTSKNNYIIIIYIIYFAIFDERLSFNKIADPDHDINYSSNILESRHSFDNFL